MRVAVKVCGVCSAADAGMAAAAGADWIGVILAPDRRRTRTLEEARRIFDASPARRVGVFVDAEAGEAAGSAAALALDAVQLHGDESSAYVRALRRTTDAAIWKAVRVRSPGDVSSAIEQYADDVDAILLDGWSQEGHGGVGAVFDWDAVARHDVVRSGMRLIIAGGLNPANVARAVSVLRPAIVDVSSGVEDAPGRKSAGLVQAFVAAVRGVEESQ